MEPDSPVDLARRLLGAVTDRDERRVAAFYAEDAIFRMAGVPRAFGGVVEGREAIMENFRRQPPASHDVQVAFGTDRQACVVAKREGTIPTTQTFRGSDHPFATYECMVFRFEDGRVKEQTAYVNWLDAYVQAGLVDLGSLLT
jgi:ketosteroid isomerase-like protein